jgi:PAS domain S-box-containing protein
MGTSGLDRTSLELRAFIDGIPALAWSALPDGFPEFFNQRCSDYSGLSPDQICAQWKSSLHGDHAEEFEHWWDGLQKSRTTGQVEVRLRRADGEFRWFLIAAAPVHDQQGRLIRWYGINIDIDDRKRAEQQLRQNEEDLRTITDTIRQFIVVLAPDGTTLYANKVALENTGFTTRDFADEDLLTRAGVFKPAHVPGQPAWNQVWWLAAHPDDRDRIPVERQKGLSQGIPFEMEARLRFKTGEYRWQLFQYNPLKDENGEVIRWYVTSTDIDDRKRAEDQLRNENLVLREEVERVRLGQYTLDEKIGEGGMGVVYRARHAMLRRPTAIKLLPPQRMGHKNLERFEREVQLTAMLTHPNTVAIYDYGRTPDGVFYYAMEFLDGINLEDLVRRFGAQPQGRVISILRQVCKALAEAHDLGVIHRDIKPGNIMLTVRGGEPDVVKVVDFGLVKELDTDSGLSSETNVLVGTPLYLSPEAISIPGAIDARADLYALGAVGYFLVTGQPLFEGRTIMEICAHHLHTAPVPPSVRLGRPVGRHLEAVLLSCLEKDPARRPPTAMAVHDALAASNAASDWSTDDPQRWWAAYRRDGPATSRPTEVETIGGGLGGSVLSSPQRLSDPLRAANRRSKWLRAPIRAVQQMRRIAGDVLLSSSGFLRALANPRWWS